MPNHFGVQILCHVSPDADPDLSELTDVDLCDRVLPMPDSVKGEVPGANPPWYEWAISNWGTKWGTYNTTAETAPGDNFSSVWVSFQSAWGPPKNEVMQKILDYLATDHQLFAELIMYFEPFDESWRMEIPRRGGCGGASDE